MDPTRTALNNDQDTTDYKQISCIKARKVGHAFVYTYGNTSIVIGPDYQGIFASFTMFSLVYILAMRCIVVSPINFVSKTVHIVLTTLLVAISIYLYSVCAFIDPGFLTSDFDFPSDAKLGYYCFECNLSKSRDYTHCYDCDRCILSKENHCGWVGKCIGARTSVYFKWFKMCTGAGLFVVLYLFSL